MSRRGVQQGDLGVDERLVWPGSVLEDGRFRWAVEAPPERTLPDEPRLLAGAAEVDITPPPGMPKAGHSKNAHDGTGFRTRLRARVVHLRHRHTSVALVALDLLAGSALVQHALARRVSDLDLDVEGIFLTATHTHAGPGQYSGSAFYNDWASNRPGFDPGYAAFLVEQLERAVREAVGSRRPARVAFGETEVWGLTRNRSLGAHVRNRGLEDRRTEAQRKYAAIDPRLHLLRVDDEDGPLAAYSWFSIHGTGISHHDASYNADVWAYLNGELAARVEASAGRRPVCAAAVASHGDMTPAVRPGMLVFPEAERVGRGIGAAAAALHERLGDSLSEDVALAVSLREVDLATHPTVDGITLPGPRIGWAKTAGAAENTTPVLPLIPPFRAGWGRRPRGPHGEKRIAATELGHARLVGPEHAFPTRLPVHLLVVGDTAVVGLPFETTAEAGRRISAAVLNTDLAVSRAFVSSLVDDHCDYLTTAEEYTAQYYEGASTLFGPEQLAFVTGVARDVAGDLARGVLHRPSGRTFDFGVRRYLARPDEERAPRRLGRVRFVEATRDEDAHWEQEWTDVAPGALAWHEPLVRVEAESADGWLTVADDQGWRVGVTYRGRRRGGHRYVTRWYGPPLGRPGKHRFVLLANAGRPEVAGPAFD